MGFTRAQVGQLLQPINPDRVLRDGKGHSHVSQQDVVAHLIRVFGFGNYDIEILQAELVFETERVKDGRPSGRWDVCYRAMARLTVRDPDGNEICHYEDGSTATAENQKRGDGHDLAYKSAISLSKKRAAIHLGDQFGLSLYNKGQLPALVRGSLVIPEGEAAEKDVQEGVEKQVSLGNDEIERDLDGGEQPTPEPVTDPVWLTQMEAALASAADAGQLQQIGAEIDAAVRAGKVAQVHNQHLFHLFQTREGELKGSVAA